jgi:hypothetical protein
MSEQYNHIALYRDDLEYKALCDFFEDEGMVDDTDPRLDRWSPMNYPGINGPLTIAETFTKIIIWDQDASEILLNTDHPHCEYTKELNNVSKRHNIHD